MLWVFGVNLSHYYFFTYNIIIFPTIIFNNVEKIFIFDFYYIRNIQKQDSLLFLFYIFPFYFCFTFCF